MPRKQTQKVSCREGGSCCHPPRLWLTCRHVPVPLFSVFLYQALEEAILTIVWHVSTEAQGGLGGGASGLWKDFALCFSDFALVLNSLISWLGYLR